AQLHKRDIRVYDSGTVSMSLGCIVQAAAEVAKQGASAAEVAREISVDTLGTGFYALLDTLRFAQRSGRINMAQALMAGMLQIKPVISIRAGVVAAVDRRRTLRKGLERLVALASRDAPFRHLAVLHAGNSGLADELAAQLRPLHGDVEVLPVGAVIGTHCGPGAVAACYLRR
ncbi:MAG: DegV family protein, partial [Chloroflexota bacterium]